MLRLLPLVSLLSIVPALATAGEESLVLPSNLNPAEAIDRAVAARWQAANLSPAPACSDAEYARRVTLDLAGRLPTRDELTRFQDNTPEERRALLVDALLASSDHAEHMADVFDALWMGRRGAQANRERRDNGWKEFLAKSFRSNRPWNLVVRDVLLARPSGQDDQGSTWFLFERRDKHQEIAEAIAPAVFGFRIECAQCHDHPLADEIEQRHYWGLVAFFRRGKNVKTKAGPRIAESAIGGFEQFADLLGDSHPNLLAFPDRSTIAEERPKDGQKQQDDDSLYRKSEREGEPKIPRFSRREKFVEEILEGHPRVGRSLVNRMWAVMMGRGLVHPHDEMDSQHPPSHPELLEWLADDFARSGFNVRRLLRHIVSSQPYQLSSIRPSADSNPADFSWSLEKPLIAEAWLRSVSQVIHGATTSNDARKLADAVRERMPEVLPDVANTTVDQALFWSNNQQLHAFLRADRGDHHLANRLLALPDHESQVQELFATAFGRSPDGEEQARAIAFLEAREERIEAAVFDLIWAAVTSAEFRFNH